MQRMWNLTWEKKSLNGETCERQDRDGVEMRNYMKEYLEYYGCLTE